MAEELAVTTLKTIVHPTDFSGTSADALRLAGRLARDLGASLLVLHVAEPSNRRERVGDADAKEKQERLEAWLSWLRAIVPNLRLQGRIVEGAPVDRILGICEENDSDLIVMGSHGRTSLGRVLLGSVAECVASQATCPVLILKGSPGRSVVSRETLASPYVAPKILVPTDFSSHSRAALDVARVLADESTRIVVIHVAGLVHVASEGYAEALEERLCEFSSAISGVHVESRLREGDAADEILNVANEGGCPLIVISSHGRTGLERLFMGSVTERILKRAPGPILILRNGARLDLFSLDSPHAGTSGDP